MTLAEQVRALAKQADEFARVFGIVDQGSMGIKAELHAQVLRTMAAEVEGKVLVKPEIEKIQVGFKFKGQIGKHFAYGETEAEVAANLQRQVDAGNDLT